MVDAFMFASFAVGGLLKKIKKHFFRSHFLRVVFSCIVAAKIMIIPYGQRFCLRSQFLELWFSRKPCIFCLQRIHVVSVTINIITQINKKVGFVRCRQREDGLCIRFVGARTKSDCGYYRFFFTGAVEQQSCKKQC